MRPDAFAEADFAEQEPSRTRQKTNGHAREAAPPPGAIIIDPSAPYKVANGYVDRNFTHDEKRTLHYHRGGFYSWSGSAYPEVTDTDIRSGLYRYLDQCVAPDRRGAAAAGQTKPGDGRQCRRALRAAAHLKDGIVAASMAGYGSRSSRRRDRGVQQRAAAPADLTLLPHTPAFFTHNAVDFAYDPAAPEPRHGWRSSKQLWPDDPASIDTLQEIFGLADGRHPAPEDVPDRRAEALRQGHDRAHLARPDRQRQHRRADAGRPRHQLRAGTADRQALAIISDARLGGRADQHAIAERLLSITGEDTITVDRKYRAAWTGRCRSGS